MPPNRPRPAPRHKTPRRRRNPRRAPLRASRAGYALRSIVVTPTFAAALGVVLAAAVAGPPAPMVLSTTPDRGTPCWVNGCSSGTGKGTPAVRPGTKRLDARRPAQAGGRGQASQRRPAGSPSGGQFVVEYRTVHQGRDGNFIGEITVASRGSQPAGDVTLRFSYRPGRIQAAWANAPLSYGAHSVTVVAGQHPGRSPGGRIHVMFSVSGPAGPPAACTANGEPCRLTTG
ncbi:MAG: hypothetical protein J2P34_01905 [Actinobacteria bacterium]|nr:hypothetical protein [Actinomycetota bacterium]